MGFLSEGVIRINVTVPIATVAKIRTEVDGKMITVRRDKIPEPFQRPMSVSDYVGMIIERELKDVVPNEAAEKWITHQVARCSKNRRIAKLEVEAGKNRKPKSEWKKRGRKAGVVYPKYEEAMKRMRLERELKKAQKELADKESGVVKRKRGRPRKVPVAV